MRTRNIYQSGQIRPYELSRSRLGLFRDCPRCFYLDRRLGVDRVSGPPFILNSATDTLLKKEFDAYRRVGQPHPLMEAHGLDLIPLAHESMDDWRNFRRGVRHLHTDTNLLIFGAVDDVWAAPNGTLHVVDYKSTATEKEITLNDPWKVAYKRQMEIYQWLLRRNGFTVSDTGYFVYANADTSLGAFNARLEFKTSLIPYAGNDNWIDTCVRDALATLNRDPSDLPTATVGCSWCQYRSEAHALEAANP